MGSNEPIEPTITMALYPILSLQEAVSEAEAALSNSYLMLQIGLGRDMDKMRKGRDMSFTTPFLAYPQ